MKNHFLILKGTLSVSLIVLSIAVPVNRRVAGKIRSGNTQVADGVPLPLPPTPKAISILVADGVPLPLPPTPKATGVLVADGVPLPLPPTPKSSSAFPMTS
jgi:hypothetical protein